MKPQSLTSGILREWLVEEDPVRLEQLWYMANEARRRTVGDAVHLRGLIEFSNRCIRNCTYCGLRVDNLAVPRYAVPVPEILESVSFAREVGIRTIVMQSGEGVAFDAAAFAPVFESIARAGDMAITLSVGELTVEEFKALRKLGVSRYLLRFETSNADLYRTIHPARRGCGAGDRIAMLRQLRDLDFEVGSGVMVGIPGQSVDDLVNDLLLFRELDLDMVGVGPYMPHPGTPLAAGFERSKASYLSVHRELLTYKMVALTRLLLPDANIPSTTALATLNAREGRLLALKRGANVLMPNITPTKYRSDYSIYPEKAGTSMGPDDSVDAALATIGAAGCVPGTDRGDSLRFRRRRKGECR
jgi:biotin synthase